jgi:hypothetical protein
MSEIKDNNLEIKDSKVLSNTYKKNDILNLIDKLNFLNESNNKAFEDFISDGTVTIEDLKTVWKTKEKLFKLKEQALHAIFDLEREEITGISKNKTKNGTTVINEVSCEIEIFLESNIK